MDIWKKFNNRPTLVSNRMPIWRWFQSTTTCESAPSYWRTHLIIVSIWNTNDRPKLTRLLGHPPKSSSKREREFEGAPVSLNPKPFQDVTGSQTGTIPLSHHLCKAFLSFYLLLILSNAQKLLLQKQILKVCNPRTGHMHFQMLYMKQ